MSLDLNYYQKLLEIEKTKLEEELGTVAHKNPDAPQDWVANYPTPDASPGAMDEVADQEEEFENTTSLELGLESRLHDINDALDRIKNGNYGVCAVGKEEIGEDRLGANPAALTCIKHASSENL